MAIKNHILLTLVITAIAVLQISFISCASVIELENENKIEGEVIDRESDPIVLKDSNGIEMRIPKDIIRSIDGEMIHTVVMAQPVETDPGTPEIIIQSAHKGMLNSIVVNPNNNNEIVTAGQDGTIKTWNIKTGELIHELITDHARISSIALSPDGKLLASAGHSKVNIWDYNSKKVIRKLENLHPLIVRFSPDGRKLAIGLSTYAGNTGLKIWDLEKEDFVSLESSDPEDKNVYLNVYSLLFNRSGDILIAGRRIYDRENERSDGDFVFWDLESGKPMRKMKGMPFSANSMALNEDESLFAYILKDDIVVIRDMKTGKQVQKIKGYFSEVIWMKVHTNVFELSFCPDGENIALGGRNGLVKIFRVTDGKLIKTYSGNADTVGAMTYTPDGTKLIIGGWNGKIRMWDVETAELLFEVDNNKFYLITMDFSPDGKKLSIGNSSSYWGNSVQTWDLETGAPPISFWTLLGWVLFKIDFSPDGNTLAVGIGDESIRFHDPETGKEESVLKGLIDSPDVSSYTEDGKFVISFDNEYGTLTSSQIWDLESQSIIRTIESESKYKVEAFATDQFMSKTTTHPAFSPENKRIAYGLDEVIRVRQMDNWEVVNTLVPHQDDRKGVFFSARFISENELLAANYGSLMLWDIEKGEYRKIWEKTDPNVWFAGYEYISGKNMVATYYHSSNVVKLWNMDDASLARELIGHSGMVTGVKYDPVNSIMATISSDGSTKLWNPDTGELIITTISLSDGNWFVTTPSGYFDCSPEGKKYIRWRIGDKIYAPDQFFDRFYRPGLLAAVVAGDDPAAEGDIRLGFEIPPDMSIVSPGDETAVGGDGSITIKVKADDKGGGVKNLKVYVNGKIAARDIRSVGSTIEKEYALNLAPGSNRIRVFAHSKDDTRSDPAEITVFYETDQMKDQDLFIIDVGVSQYMDRGMSLDYADSDAIAFADRLESGGGKLFTKINRYEILNADATREKISQVMEEVKAAAEPEDVVVVFMAGHGVTVDKNYYFIPHELVYNSSEDVVKSGINQKAIMEFLSSVKAQKTLLVLDTCESGGMVLAMKTRGMDRKLALEKLARSVGSFLISASSDKQAAMENSELKHGLLTQTILDALGGKADMPPSDGAITVMELLPYIQMKVPDYARDRFGHSQYPQVLMYGMDFPLILN